MTQCTLPQLAITRLVKTFNKANPDHTHLSITWDNLANTLNVVCNGLNTGLSVLIPGTKLTVKADKNHQCSVQAKQFINALTALSDHLSIELSIGSNFLSITGGSQQIKLPVEVMQTYNYTGIQTVIKDMPVAALIGIVNGMKPISNANAITVFKEGHALTVDSSARETICLSKLPHVLPKDVTVTVAGAPRTVSCVLGLRSKDLDGIANTLTAFSGIISNDKVEVLGEINGNSISSLSFRVAYTYTDSGCQDVVYLRVRLLDDDKFKKEAGILDKAIKFAPMFKVTVPASFTESASNAKVVDTEAKLHISNKLNQHAIAISTPSESYKNTMAIESDCIFDVVVRNNSLEKILSRFEGPIDIMLHDKTPIVALSPNLLDMYLVSCFNSPMISLPFEVSALPPVKKPETTDVAKESTVVGT